MKIQIVYKSKAEERQIKKIKGKISKAFRDIIRVLIVASMAISGITALICVAAIDSVENYQLCLGIMILAIAYFGISAGLWMEIEA